MPWVKFNRLIPNTPVCAVSRGNIWTGRRTANLGGWWRHGLSGDAAVAGTTAYWDTQAGGGDSGRNVFPSWLQRAGYHTAMVGKYLNGYPFARGDSYIPFGWNEWRAFVDDASLGGAHAAHIGPEFFDYYLNLDGVLNGPFAGPQSAGTDPWTTTGADASGRTAASNYSTDRLSSVARKLIDGTSGGLREPFYLHLATYGVKQGGAGLTIGPARRHLSPFAYADFGRPASFNEANLADKPEWLREHVPTVLSGATDPTVTFLDDTRVAKGRTSLAIDEALRDIVATLTARTTPGVAGTWMDRTMVVVLTEHSNAMGEHRLYQKGLPYECCVTTPAFVHYPSSGDRWNLVLVVIDDAVKDMWGSMPYLSSLPSATSDALVSTIDIAPTFLQVARAARHATKRPDGMSFLPLLQGAITESQWRQAVVSEWTESDLFPQVPTWRSVRTHTHRYTELQAHSGGGSGAETELYDLVADPDEMVNLTNDGAQAATKAVLARQLAALVAG